MGDRCYMTIYVHRDDLPKFCEIIGEDVSHHPAREGMTWAEVTIEEANYALYEELTEAAKAKLRFSAQNSAGDCYGHGAMVCNGEECIEVDTDHEGNPTVTVPLYQPSVDTALRYLEIVQAMEIRA
jgi:hypothetical protein